MPFVTDDPVAASIVEECGKLPDGAIWEALPMEGELDPEALRGSSLLAALLFYLNLKDDKAECRFVKVSREFPVDVRTLVQRAVRCTMPPATSQRILEQQGELGAAGIIILSTAELCHVLATAVEGKDLPPLMVGILRLVSGEQAMVFMCLKDVAPYSSQWKITRHMVAAVLENDENIDNIGAC